MAETPIINNQVMAEINKLPSYPVKYLTYSEMQQLRDQGLCLNCNDIDTPNHCCSIKRILLVMPDEDPTIEQQSMETVKPAVPTTLPISGADAPSLHQPSLSIMAPSSPIKPSDSTHQILKHFSDSHIEFLFGINIGSPMQQQICLDVYCGVVPFAVLCMRQALDPILPTMQKWDDAQDMFVEMSELKYERKILIFDPGGDIFNAKCFFALWSNHAGYNINGHGNKMLNKFDKCFPTLRARSILKGWVMIRTSTTTGLGVLNGYHVHAASLQFGYREI